MSLTIPKKIYRRFGVETNTQYIALIKNNIDNLSDIFEIYEKIEMEEDLKKELNDYQKIIKESISQIDSDSFIRLLIDNDKIKTYYLYKKLKFQIDEYLDNDNKPIGDEYITHHIDDFILKNTIYGIFHKNILAGFVIIENSKTFFIDEGSEKVETNYIQEIYIDDEYKNKKFGTKLINYIILRYFNKPERYFSLMTTDDNYGMISVASKFKFIAQIKLSGDPKHSLLFIMDKSINIIDNFN
jgi:GNAT superfamily N-acetyltransferase